MRFAVLVSGRGTNLQALLDAEAAGRLAPAEVACVVSNRPGVQALERARQAGKPATVIDHKAFADRAAFDAALLVHLREREVDGLVLAGFMRILGAELIRSFEGRILNVHPSLLPAFPGLDAPGQALEHGVKVTGCSVHLVDAGVDSGPIIAQRCVEVRDDDDRDSLNARIQVLEHELLPEAARLLAAGALAVEGRRVRIAREDG
jgi:phosphoribosylglycinamide formyltransferase 1